MTVFSHELVSPDGSFIFLVVQQGDELVLVLNNRSARPTAAYAAKDAIEHKLEL